jgi:hypothetical protein
MNWFSRKCGNLNFSQPYELLRPVTFYTEEETTKRKQTFWWFSNFTFAITLVDGGWVFKSLQTHEILRQHVVPQRPTCLYSAECTWRCGLETVQWRLLSPWWKFCCRCAQEFVAVNCMTPQPSVWRQAGGSWLNRDPRKFPDRSVGFKTPKDGSISGGITGFGKCLYALRPSVALSYKHLILS